MADLALSVQRFAFSVVGEKGFTYFLFPLPEIFCSLQ
jgi:hypothetical protein